MTNLSRLGPYLSRYGWHLIPAEAKNIYWERGKDFKIGAYGQPGYILSTRMRSGSIWIRSLLYDYETLLQGESVSPHLSEWLAHYSPQLEVKNSVRELELGKYRFGKQIVKTHMPFEKLQPIAGNKKILVLFRQPEDTFVEQYQKQIHEGFKPDTNAWTEQDWVQRKQEIEALGIDRYAKRRAGRWRKFYQSFLDAHDKGHEIAFVSYESMHAKPQETLARIVQYFDYSVVDAHIESAIANRAFDKVKSAVKSDWDDAMTGRGTGGTGQSLLSPQALNKIKSKTEPTLSRLRDLERQESSGPAAAVSSDGTK